MSKCLHGAAGTRWGTANKGIARQGMFRVLGRHRERMSWGHWVGPSIGCFHFDRFGEVGGRGEQSPMALAPGKAVNEHPGPGPCEKAVPREGAVPLGRS
jgi:hypothetical protein